MLPVVELDVTVTNVIVTIQRNSVVVYNTIFLVKETLLTRPGFLFRILFASVKQNLWYVVAICILHLATVILSSSRSQLDVDA
jgi:hypothetical protein